MQKAENVVGGCPARQQVEIGNRRLFDEHVQRKLVNRIPFAQDVAQTPAIGLIEDAVKLRTAHVSVDQQHLAAGFGKGDAKIADHRGLAFRRPRTCDHQAVRG